ncbi:MAG: hypothetical protein HQL78_13180 [Magnetococcales bacterium]|nr:hypothetical protein [Magnetococcales bacterium]
MDVVDFIDKFRPVFWALRKKWMLLLFKENMVLFAQISLMLCPCVNILTAIDFIEYFPMCQNTDTPRNAPAIRVFYTPIYARIPFVYRKRRFSIHNRICVRHGEHKNKPVAMQPRASYFIEQWTQ